MIRRNQKLLNAVNMILDALLILFSYLLATYIRYDIMYGAFPALQLAWSPACLRGALGVYRSTGQCVLCIPTVRFISFPIADTGIVCDFYDQCSGCCGNYSCFICY